jgi:hypothetical protein
MGKGKGKFDLVFEDLWEMGKTFSYLYYEVLSDKRLTRKELEKINEIFENILKIWIIKCQDKIKERLNDN